MTLYLHFKKEEKESISQFFLIKEPNQSPLLFNYINCDIDNKCFYLFTKENEIEFKNKSFIKYAKTYIEDIYSYNIYRMNSKLKSNYKKFKKFTNFIYQTKKVLEFQNKIGIIISLNNTKYFFNYDKNNQIHKLININYFMFKIHLFKIINSPSLYREFLKKI